MVIKILASGIFLKKAFSKKNCVITNFYVLGSNYIVPQHK